ncbi:MAG: type ISP restriction/modification enzyme [Mariniphaga sp.]
MKNSSNKPLARVFHFSLQGKRDEKYSFLNDNSMQSIPWKELDYQEPYYFFVPKDFEEEQGYTRGFRVEDLFLTNNTGIQTKRDGFVYQFSMSDIRKIIEDIKGLDEAIIRKKHNVGIDGTAWTLKWVKDDISKNKGCFSIVDYHPFDPRYTYFTGFSSGFMARPRSPLMNNMLKPNIALLAVRNSRRENVFSYFISNNIVDKDGISPFDNCKVFPLYLYPEPKVQQLVGQSDERIPNLNMGIVEAIANKINLHFIEDDMIDVELAEGSGGIFKPLDILGYTYAVLYSPTYREKYKEFLKIDFPMIPYPKDQDTFWKLAELGIKLIRTHLLESKKSTKFITKYPIDGSNEVTKPHFDPDLSAVFINDTQYFANVPELAWNFFIGGYQPAQKWLKDRKGRHLEFDDIMHYQKIIVALMETDRLMEKIDLIEIE